MIHISKKSDYGLVFMTLLASTPPSQYVPLKGLAQTHKLPYKFLSQVATDLKKAQLIYSKEGFGGGYQLARPTNQITVLDIVTALEGPIAPVGCLKNPVCCHRQDCAHRQVMIKMTDSVNQTLSQFTLKDLTQQTKDSNA